MEFALTTYMAELRHGLSHYHTARERMQFALSYFFDLERFNLEFSRAWVEFWVLSKTDAAVSKALRECYREIEEVFAEVIRSGTRSGEFRKVRPMVMASTILASLEGATMLWVVGTETAQTKSIYKQIGQVFMEHLTGEK